MRVVAWRWEELGLEGARLPFASAAEESSLLMECTGGLWHHGWEKMGAGQGSLCSPLSLCHPECLAWRAF